MNVISVYIKFAFHRPYLKDNFQTLTRNLELNNDFKFIIYVLKISNYN